MVLVPYGKIAKKEGQHLSVFQHRDFFQTLFTPRVKKGPLSVLVFLIKVLVHYWQDARIRTRDAPTAARCATNELHTSLKLHTSRLAVIINLTLSGRAPKCLPIYAKLQYSTIPQELKSVEI